MKIRYLLFPVIALSVVSCIKKPGDVPVKEQVNIAAIEQMTDFTIPDCPEAGKVTVVKYGDDTLAVTAKAATFAVPKAALAGVSRAANQVGQLKITYDNASIYDDFAQYKYWYYLAFEDTPYGDYDYNDVVLHGRIVTTNKYGTTDYTHTVSLQPVAMGGTGTIGAIRVGIIYRPDGTGALQEKILCEDLRKELYKERGGFVNTEVDQAGKAKVDKVTDYLTELYTWMDHTKEAPLVWFIEAAGRRLYAATTAFDADKTFDMISPEGYPYGISFASKWNYPKEYCPIWDAYPGFKQWIKSGDENVLRAGFIRSNTFPASPAGDPSYDLWNWLSAPKE